MDNTQKILTEISTVTRDIEDNYPELQKYLDETRSTLPEGANDSAKLDEEDLKNYLDQLKEMIEKYKEN
ncbi:hypothetical protein [Winogradskyella sp. SYSU M77433]|uniref:hypothetical protein n=1 Tax=Winogradskyella sp. SYSU M77433 TaxID=3042722 RepID=UPI002480AA8D|nr:hypothetical protein [Winogradskyella sp. SYSU M77433]MDH7913741.1 hypothetical protein [Winogradskyella sp. SYSU M77433]|tara:strand:- start:245 stop:451 length:207 start_codon:yes stop_codon:yes gene_type:complete